MHAIRHVRLLISLVLAVIVALAVLVLVLPAPAACALRCQQRRVYYEVIRSKHPDVTLNRLSRHDLWLYFEATKPVSGVTVKNKTKPKR